MIEPREELKNINIYETASYPENWDMKLDSNENYIGPSTNVLNAFKNLSECQISHYPRYGELYDRLENLFDIERDCVVITNGADEALSVVINTYISKNDCIVNVKPSFSMPQIYAEAIGACYIEVPYENKWEYPFENIKKALDNGAKALVITNPNNPTGDIVPKEQIAEILNSYPQTLVILDETYASYAGHSNIDLVKKYDNVVIVRSFSKDYALAGLRLGCLISQKQNIDNMKKLLSPYNVNAAAIIAACASLDDENYLDFVKNEIMRSKVFLCDELQKLGFTAYSSYANFVLADFGESAQKAANALKENKIVVKSFNDSALLKNCLRITVPTFTAASRLVSLLKQRNTLVFDMDGVMIDVSTSYFEAIKYTYKHFTGKTIDDAAINDARKLGGLNNDWDLTQFLIKESGFDFSYEKIVEVFQKQYWDDGRGSINGEKLLIKPELLQELSLKYNLAVFTGRPKDEAIYTLKKFDIEQYFSKIVTMDDVPVDRQKPHTNGLAIIKDNFLTENIIYFGDTVDDAKCASDFGVYGVGVLPPSNKSEEHAVLLQDRGAKAVIENINELTTILENFNNENEHYHS